MENKDDVFDLESYTLDDLKSKQKSPEKKPNCKIIKRSKRCKDTIDMVEKEFGDIYIKVKRGVSY